MAKAAKKPSVSSAVSGKALKKPLKVDEKTVKRWVRGILKDEGVWYCTPLGMGMGPPCHDFCCCVPTPSGGRFLSIETKASDGKASARQLETMRVIEEAGGVVALVYPTGIDGLRTLIRDMKEGTA